MSDVHDSSYAWRIRAFQPADLPRLKEITVATFGPVSIDGNMEKTFGQFGQQEQAGWQGRKLAAIEEDCRLQPDGVFIAQDQAGLTAGYITTRLNITSRVGWIANLAVDPAWQGKGIGRNLIEFALQFFRGRGMQVARIETLEQNPVGRALYPSVGFVEIARQIHYGMRLDNPPQ